MATPERRFRVSVLMGGPSGEREVSMATGATVARRLEPSCDVKPVEICADGSWVVPGGFDSIGDGSWQDHPRCEALAGAARLSEEGVEVVFNALHGPIGEDGTIQGFLRIAGLPVTGPEGVAAAVTMDKALSKRAMESAGIPTPPWFVIPPYERVALDWEDRVRGFAAQVPFPWVLKPNRLGSSVGIGVFATPSELLDGADELVASWPTTANGDAILVESLVEGRELSCAVVEIDDRARALPPIELRPREREFFDYHAKYTPGATEELCPAPISAASTAAVEELCVRAHRLFGCAPLSRVDLFVTSAEKLIVLEVNTLPGMTETSLVPLAASRAGLSLEELFTGLIAHAIARHEREASPSVVLR